MSPCDILPAPLNGVKDVWSICGTLIVIPKADATRTCGKTVREALSAQTMEGTLPSMRLNSCEAIIV